MFFFYFFICTALRCHFNALLSLLQQIDQMRRIEQRARAQGEKGISLFDIYFNSSSFFSIQFAFNNNFDQINLLIRSCLAMVALRCGDRKCDFDLNWNDECMTTRAKGATGVTTQPILCALFGSILCMSV